jgi:3-hydroxybutyryl-CoA dehydrogenase
VIGLHFFNPVPIMGLVEVVPGTATDPAVVERATDVMRGWGKTPIVVADRPGFIVNRVNRPFTIEALRIIEEGAATVEDVDAAMRDAGFPIGPFEFMDLTGIDVNLAAARAVWDGLGRPDHLRPSLIQERLVEQGRFGRKTGSGFYRYESGRRTDIDPEFAAPTARAGSADLDTPTPTVIRDRIVAAIGAEATRAAADGVATIGDIAIALRLGAGHPKGIVPGLPSD